MYLEENSMKRLVVCCDGTWQDLSKEYPTNVVKMAQAVKTKDTTIPQIVFYGQGIGSGGELLNRVGGGAFGWGIDQNIQDAYRFLCLNYDPGDEIYLFGFSRGAYTVRSLAGLIRCAGGLNHPPGEPSRGGLLPRNEIRKTPQVYEIYRSKQHKNKEEEYERKTEEMARLAPKMQKDVRIKLLGCWDTVGSLGIPQKFSFLNPKFNERYRFHDYQLSGIIDNALHAVAIDEPRKVFDVTPMKQSESSKQAGQQLRQVWFPGDHGCVGGGVKKVQGLSDGALQWMIDQMKDLNLGLDLDPNLVECDLSSVDVTKQYGIYPDHKTPFANTSNPLMKWIFSLVGTHVREIAKADEDFAAILEQRLHESVLKRWKDYKTQKPPYEPENLKKFKEAIEEYLKKAAQAAQEVVEQVQDIVQDAAGTAQDIVQDAANNLADRVAPKHEPANPAIDPVPEE
jgi:uncharacterized protein (DUF2235 family)